MSEAFNMEEWTVRKVKVNRQVSGSSRYVRYRINPETGHPKEIEERLGSIRGWARSTNTILMQNCRVPLCGTHEMTNTGFRGGIYRKCRSCGVIHATQTGETRDLNVFFADRRTTRGNEWHVVDEDQPSDWTRVMQSYSTGFQSAAEAIDRSMAERQQAERQIWSNINVTGT